MDEDFDKPMRAGGRATEAGMAFQAEVGTWIAAHLLARSPVGGRFGINNTALPLSLRLETGEGLDDIDVEQSDGGAITIQCKTRATLASGEKAPLTKTLHQLAHLVSGKKAATGLPDLTKNVGVLAVRSDAPATLDHLHNGCRAFDTGGRWKATKSQRSKNEKRALDVFEKITGKAWKANTEKSAKEVDFVDMARFFRVERFSMSEGSQDWREASRLLGSRVFGSEALGEAALRDLKGVVRGLISSGAPADRLGLLRELRKRGHLDCRSPDYDSDLARLCEFSNFEIERLSSHLSLPIGSGVPVHRESDELLLSAIHSGSLLVVGEPGAGKTGSLLNAATHLTNEKGETALFLSVDRFPGVSISSDLQSELGLEHPLLDVLLNFPGGGRKTIFLDALDAARGGPSEAVFATLIDDILRRAGNNWTVVASIRTFDLKNGQKFRTTFEGTPPVTELADKALSNTRHICVPVLSDRDFENIAKASAKLGEVFSKANPAFKNLLRNIFNLSLAARLLESSTGQSSLEGIKTQSELIDLYEDERLSNTQLQRATAATIGAMISRQRITVRKVAIDHDAVDQVIRTGVLVDAGDLVSFAHHILFDHAAGRFHLEWDDQAFLLNQIKGDTGTALLLAPALRFAVDRLWRTDDEGCPKVWSLILAIFSTQGIDPVLSNIALRVAVENVECSRDLQELEKLLERSPVDKGLINLINRLSRFAGLDASSFDTLHEEKATTWARLAKTLFDTGEQAICDAGRYLLQVLFDKGDCESPMFVHEFGKASRTLLDISWAGGPQLQRVSESAIRFVGKSYASDPATSRALLSQILIEPRFSAQADREAPWLAEQIIQIAKADPEFAAEVYCVLFTKDISDEQTTYLGGSVSRILPLSSNRKQDYQHARWRLGREMKSFLELSVEHATRALIDAHLGYLQRERFGAEESRTVKLEGGQSFEIRGREYAYEFEPESPAQDDDMLAQYFEFLRSCEVSSFSKSASAATQEYSCGAIWARLFRAGSERVEDLGEVLWDLATHNSFLRHEDTFRDAVDFVSAAYSSRSIEQRQAFEAATFDLERFSEDPEGNFWRSVVDRLLREVPEDQLVLEGSKHLRKKMVEASDLKGSTSLQKSRTTNGDLQDFRREELIRAGVDINQGANAEVLTASDRLYELVQKHEGETSHKTLQKLWKQSIELVQLIDIHAENLVEDVAHPAWGHISNAIAQIASSSDFDPTVDGLPSLEELFTVLDRLSESPFPKGASEEA